MEYRCYFISCPALLASSNAICILSNFSDDLSLNAEFRCVQVEALRFRLLLLFTGRHSAVLLDLHTLTLIYLLLTHVGQAMVAN
jgi:hypothetical protein